MEILKRKHARIVRVLSLIAIALLAVLLVMTRLDVSDAMMQLVVTVFVLMMLCASVIGGRTLKCPYCGKGKAMSTWNPGRQTQRCRKCGKPLVFDDEVKPEK